MKILTGKSVIHQMDRITKKASDHLKCSVNIEINVWNFVLQNGETTKSSEVRIWRGDVKEFKTFPDLKQAHDYLCSIIEQSERKSK